MNISGLPKSIAIALIACWIAIGCSQLDRPSVENANAPIATLTVSAAASLQDALEAIDPLFAAAEPDIALNYNFASSGALQRQIEQGAPADIFFSAASQQMDALEAKNLILTETRRDLVANALVAIAPKNANLELDRWQQLNEARIGKIAVGEFRSVPAGQYAQEAFTHLGLLESLQPKFVFGNNVRSVLAAVESGNVDAGIVYATDAQRSDGVKIVASAPPDSHDAIVYPIAALAESSNVEAATIYMKFLADRQAQAVFEQFGFGKVHSPLSSLF